MDANAAGDEIPLDLREAQLDLVGPGRVGRRKVQMLRRVRFEKRCNGLRLLSREVVDDDVDLFTSWLACDGLRKESNELGGGVAGSRLAENADGFRVQSRVQAKRPVPKVFEAMALRSAGRERKDRIETVQCLNGRLFIYAEDRRMCRRLQIQADDVSSLLLEMRIVGRHVTLDPMRFKTMLCPDAGDRHVVDAQMPPQLASAPMGRPVVGLAPDRVQDARFELGRDHTGRLPHVSADQPTMPAS